MGGTKEAWAVFVALAIALCAAGAARGADARDEARVDELEKRVRQLEKRVEEKEEGERPATGLQAYWKEGLRLDTADGTFKLKLGGRIQNDWALFDADDDVEERFGELGSGTEFRRARLFIEGEVYENVKFKAEYDFAGGDANFTDV